MKNLLTNIKIKVNDKLFLKDPESSEIGKSIIKNSILLIDEIGFEEFTFKKLGEKIGSPECTIYRYFESKHRILLYLTTWYWSRLEYRLLFSIANISSPKERLRNAIKVFTETVKDEGSYSHINEVILYKIIVVESTKSYLTKKVDDANNDGLYETYKRVVQRGADMILALQPSYKYSHMLISTVMEGAHQHRHFAEHLPKLTDVKNKDQDITTFFTEIVFKTIKIETT